MSYTLGSLFDGSGGFPLAGSLCGIVPKWAAEVEPYPIAVTRSRFPGMRHLGDISKVNGADIEPVDVVTFGSPCQDLSTAGKRAGLKHEDNGDDETTRSGLFMEAVRVIREMREATNGVYPRIALWENVPGAFTSNKGEDFRIVLQELIQIVEPSAVMPAVPKNGWPYADNYCGDGWSLAYRVFDAQYWGVPQRRRRIHLVVDFRGQGARQICFEREGVRGYFDQSSTPWKATAADTERGPGAADRAGAVPYTLKIRSGCEGGGKGALVQTNKSATIKTCNDQYLFQPVYCLQCGGKSGTAKQNGTGVAENVSYTLTARDCHGVAYSINGAVAGTLDANYYKGPGERMGTEREVIAQAVDNQYIVRRLIPTECARLQGFADMWGHIDRKDSFTGDEYAFWCKVNLEYDVMHGKARPDENGNYEIWREVKPDKKKGEDFAPYWENTGKPYKHKNQQQMLIWYNKLRTPAAEYKMWGNGIALPPAIYIMQGIVDALGGVTE